MPKKKDKLIKELEAKRNDMILMLKHKLSSPYTESEERLEILEWFKRFYNDEVFVSTKSMLEWFKDLRRLSKDEK